MNPNRLPAFVYTYIVQVSRYFMKHILKRKRVYTVSGEKTASLLSSKAKHNILHFIGPPWRIDDLDQARTQDFSMGGARA